RDGEDATQPLVQTFLRRGLLGLRVGVIRPRQYTHRGGGQRQPCDHASSCDRSRNSLCHSHLLRVIAQSSNRRKIASVIHAQRMPSNGNASVRAGTSCASRALRNRRRARCNLYLTIAGRRPRKPAVSSTLISSISRITNTTRKSSGKSSIARST